MTLRGRVIETGEDVEVLALTGDRLALVAPPGHPELARLVPAASLEPDPREVSVFEGFSAWTDRSLATERGEA